MDSTCWWAPAEDALYRAYHDVEWGFPVADDTQLFEKLCLEGFQAGLSWRTVLGKREAFREAFGGFDIDIVAGYGGDDVERMLGDRGLIRHRGKITAAISNAVVAQAIRGEAGSLAAFVWRYAPPHPRQDCSEEAVRAAVVAADSTRLAADLRKRGWRFLGPTSAHAFAQAVGLVNDHVETCPVRPRVEQARAGFSVPV